MTGHSHTEVLTFPPNGAGVDSCKNRHLQFVCVVCASMCVCVCEACICVSVLVCGQSACLCVFCKFVDVCVCISVYVVFCICVLVY